MNKLIAIAVFTPYFAINTANAQQIIYTPVNPAFGGSSFNYTYLQGTADAQNQFKNKPKTLSTTGIDYTKQFIQMLETRLYSTLAQRVSDILTGDNCKTTCSGEITLGDQKVAYSNDGTQTILQLTDATGKVTTISIPTISTSTGP